VAFSAKPLQTAAVKPTDITPIGDDLAIKWEDESETFIPLKTLRLACPCAACKGEVDIMGNLHKNQEQPLKPNAFRLARVTHIGGYAVQPLWGDGHGSGIFPFEYLKRLGEAAE
jgi:DUF971 family protein